MSSGACRALLALLITVAITLTLALPAFAQSDQLTENAVVTYAVDPNDGQIDVSIGLRLRPAGNRAFSASEWGPLYVEDRIEPPTASNSDFSVADTSSGTLHRLWRSLFLEVPRIEPGESEATQVLYSIDAAIDNSAATLDRTPARVGRGYIYFCIQGQDVDDARFSVEIPDRFEISQLGTPFELSDRGLELATSEPGDVFTCIEATDASQLAETSFVGPGNRQIVLQAWPEWGRDWLVPAETFAGRALDELRDFLALEIPGSGPVIIRQAPPQSLGGYASAHGTPGIVQLDETAGARDAYHELAHVWFGADRFREQWMREGLADWAASAIIGETCLPAGGEPDNVDLGTWQVVRPTAPNDIGDLIEEQDAAACGIMSAVAERMGEDAWRDVLGSMLRGETKYVGRGGADAATSGATDYREWLDAVDERGLVPAGVTDLDFAQDLLAAHGVVPEAALGQLEERSAARARYHEFLANADVLGAPRLVREAMDNWYFTDALAAIDVADAAVAQLKAADDLLPEAGLLPIMRPAFEAAATPDDLAAVLVQAEGLANSANEVIGPVNDLIAASPEGWEFPAALRNAIADLDFDGVEGAIDASLEIVEDLRLADEALPEAGLLERYRSRYESTATTTRLEMLAERASEDRVAAERTGAAIRALEQEAGEWVIPDVVTRPIDRGQLAAAQTILEDARLVVRAARDADAALPEAGISSEIRAAFEQVASAAEMAELSMEAQELRNDAQTVGGALDTLRATVPGWVIPEVVNDPIQTRDFASAAVAARAAQRWVEAASKTDEALPDFAALDQIEDGFESATSLEDLLDGAEQAESWATAASAVREARDSVARPRDLLTELGLWGTDLNPDLEQATEAALAGQVGEAIDHAQYVIDTIANGGSSGALRLAGLIFFAVAILGVLGMWFIFRRQAGPSWARQTTPHWMKDGKHRQLRRPKEKPASAAPPAPPKQIGRGRRR